MALKSFDTLEAGMQEMIAAVDAAFEWNLEAARSAPVEQPARRNECAPPEPWPAPQQVFA